MTRGPDWDWGNQDGKAHLSVFTVLLFLKLVVLEFVTMKLLLLVTVDLWYGPNYH